MAVSDRKQGVDGPTELLAEQHFVDSNMLAGTNVRV